MFNYIIINMPIFQNREREKKRHTVFVGHICPKSAESDCLGQRTNLSSSRFDKQCNLLAVKPCNKNGELFFYYYNIKGCISWFFYLWFRARGSSTCNIPASIKYYNQQQVKKTGQHQEQDIPSKIDERTW